MKKLIAAIAVAGYLWGVWVLWAAAQDEALSAGRLR